MQDHLHDYNIAVKDARLSHRYAVRKATEIYERESTPLLNAYERALDAAAEQFREAMGAAEDAYQDAVAAAASEPPF